MANKRCFSQSVVGQDSFLEMPLSSQALYFHLGMGADVLGFVTPNKVMRMLGCAADDLRVLVAKGFVIPFESGVVVITHWQSNNVLRMDREAPSQYENEYKKLRLDKSKSYQLLENSGSTPGELPPKLSKVKLSKVNNPPISPLTADAVVSKKEELTGDEPEFRFWTDRVGTKIRSKLKENVAAAKRLRKNLGDEDFSRAVETIRMVRADKHAGRFLHVIGNYIQLEKHIEAIEAYRRGIDERSAFDRVMNPQQVDILGF